MDSEQQQHLADVLRDYRERLESARKDHSRDLDEGGVPTDATARRMLEVEVRMLDVENFLLTDLERQEAPTGLFRRVRRAPQRARQLSTPRLGWLHHHKAWPLRVPTSYLSTQPPRPAPSISIVTPSFQQGHFLERTLYSVVNQNYPALEYVVQDGGSTDGTVDVLRRYEKTLTRWVSQNDAGQADAINRGFAGTTGEIMAYLNSDDLLLPGSLAFVAGYLADHPEVDAVYGHRVIIDEHDQEIGLWVLPPHDDEVLTLLDFVPQETLFWRRSAWEAAGGRVDPEFDFALDWDLLLRLHQTGHKIVRLPRLLGAFRAHDAQKTAVQNDLCLAECDRLRRREHGRGISHDEAVARVQPYLRRHVIHHLAHRLRARLPQRRTAVRTLPIEPWLRMPEPRREEVSAS